MEKDFRIPPPRFTEIDITSFTSRNIKVFVARLDKIHPVISGNKLFKLQFFLQEAIQAGSKTIITFGGAYSNHLVATAYCCRLAGLNCIGIVRGNKPKGLSHTLKDCQQYGMQLNFIPREKYRYKDSVNFQNELHDTFGQCYIIPEGGFHPLGAKGAAQIIDMVRNMQATHICTSVGTATTLAGLLQNARQGETIIGIPVIKNINDLEERLEYLNGGKRTRKPVLFNDYHFGGYAKRTSALTDFMNALYTKTHLPTDFVYTAKMMFAVTDKLKENFFPEDSIIMCLHTGGLQGNLSLPVNTLVF